MYWICFGCMLLVCVIWVRWLFTVCSFGWGFWVCALACCIVVVGFRLVYFGSCGCTMVIVFWSLSFGLCGLGCLC